MTSQKNAGSAENSDSIAKPTSAWAVVDRDGEIELCTIKGSKREAMDAFEMEEMMPFKNAREEFGYRCIKVRIEQVRGRS